MMHASQVVLGVVFDRRHMPYCQPCLNGLAIYASNQRYDISLILLYLSYLVNMPAPLIFSEFYRRSDLTIGCQRSGAKVDYLRSDAEVDYQRSSAEVDYQRSDAEVGAEVDCQA